jgi:5-methylcytosine-specific restriction endonuclease McrA
MSNTNIMTNSIQETTSQIERDCVNALFHGRCLVNPAHKGSDVHHICPIDRRIKNTVFHLENTVFLCRECHSMIHKDGAAVWKDRLIQLRKDWLGKYG